MEIIALLNLFGSLASIISLYRSAGADKVKPQIKTKGGNVYFEDIHETLILSDSVEVDVEKFEVIDENILNAIYNKVDKAKSRFIEALNDPRYTPADLIKEETIVSREICEALEMIKRQNRNRLPDIKALNEAWLSFRCNG